MKRILNYTLEHAQPTQTIAAFLKSKGYSPQVLLHLKRTPRGILKNGIWSRVHDPFAPGDTLTITLAEESASANIIPVNLPLDIVYEDADILIVNKAAKMPIHPSQGNYDNTLANAAAYYFKEKQEAFIFRCINRLDRDTSGLLILAKHLYSASLLAASMKNREIKREYLAVVSGELPPFGTIDAPIGRVEGSAIERQVDSAGAFAVTHYKRLYYKNGYSLASVKLDTGRTHQIRVHMKFIGHPLPGDFLYHPDYEIISRQALHSFRLSFPHPITREPLSFMQRLPNDMTLFFRRENSRRQ